MIKILQIAHKAEQIRKLDYPPIENYPPTEKDYDYLWMETNVIRKSLKEGLHNEVDFFGIFAPKYKNKIQACKQWGKDLRNNSNKSYRKDLFHRFIERNRDADIISLTHHKKHSTFNYANRYHPNISSIAQTICDTVGFNHNVNSTDPNPIYFNYWIATPQVCQALYDEILQHLPQFSDSKLLMGNARYNKPFPENLAKLFNINHWPYHPFIGERLITIFATKHKLKVASF